MHARTRISARIEYIYMQLSIVCVLCMSAAIEGRSSSTHTYLAAAADNATQLHDSFSGLWFEREAVQLFVTSKPHLRVMATRKFGLPVALSLLEIPLPEEDGMSDDEFNDPDELPPSDADVGDDVPGSEAADDAQQIVD